MYENNEINAFLPLREVVFLQLRAQILKGELKPGERLMEIALAQRLGVSRTPVREAIRMLEQEGLVIMRPRRGAQVAKITVQDLNNVLEVRKSLELLATEKACARMNAQDVEEMKKAAASFAKLIDAGEDDLTTLAEADVDFHDTIYKGAKNQRLLQILSNLSEQMYRYRIEYMKDEEIRKGLVDEHKEIMEAIEARNEKTAKKLVAKHIENQQLSIIASIEGGEETR